jgi:hypothetical protein
LVCRAAAYLNYCLQPQASRLITFRFYLSAFIVEFYVSHHEKLPGSRKSGKGRIPVKEFISKQGRFDHLKEEHYAHIQNMVDQMWEEWQIPGVAPLKGILKARI